MSEIDEKQKPTNELYRLQFSVAYGRIKNPAELRKAKLRVNEILGHEFFKGVK